MEGIINIATISPKRVFIGNPQKNAEYMIDLLDKARRRDTAQALEAPNIIVFPELSITGYTCGDLFNQSKLINDAKDALMEFARKTEKYGVRYYDLIFVGCPIRKDNQLFNCAVAICGGNIIGIIPKSHIPNYNEFYESRYFAGAESRMDDEIWLPLSGKAIPFTPNFIAEFGEDLKVSAEICEDAWVPIPPSRHHCLRGANVIVNLSASNETIGKSEYRRDMLRMHSATCACAYIYSSASVGESTSDTVFSGHQMIIENGKIVTESKALDGNEITYGQVDIEKCMQDRYRMNTFAGGHRDGMKYVSHYFGSLPKVKKLMNPVSIIPFVPNNIGERCEEIIKIQAAGLAQRLSKIGCEKVVIGISGGLDSTLALIVAREAFKFNGWHDMSNIIGVTMPAYGTSERTLNNSLALIKAFGATKYEIDITEACSQHFRDILHSEKEYDITFENTQARERTQVLMDMANKHGAIVVGTGDMSELALGWCTYNGDHMSMYAVNASIPKTLVGHLVIEYSKAHFENGADICESKREAANAIKDICDTPISPELLPPNKDGSISQRTEDSIGSYVTHDFILYYMLRYGFSPSKIFWLYTESLSATRNEEPDTEEIKKDMMTFYRRFQTQQFKRNCMPDGVKVGSIALSPRADWRMPSDSDMSIWLDEIKEL